MLGDGELSISDLKEKDESDNFGEFEFDWKDNLITPPNTATPPPTPPPHTPPAPPNHQPPHYPPHHHPPHHPHPTTPYPTTPTYPQRKSGALMPDISWAPPHSLPIQ